MVAIVSVAAMAGSGLLASGASASGLASESAQQVVKAAVAAIKGAKGYEMHFNMHHPDMVGSLIDPGNGDLSMTFDQNNTGSASLIIVGGKDYLKASAKFWASHGSSKSLAKVLAPKWYKVPNNEFGSLTKTLNQISPSRLAQCASQGHATLTNLGASTVDGQPVVIIKDPGGKPGTGPGTIAIATTGKPYPLRISQTGPTLAGGPINACNDGKASKTTGTITISHWNSPPAIKAPAHAIKLPTSSGA